MCALGNLAAMACTPQAWPREDPMTKRLSAAVLAVAIHAAMPAARAQNRADEAGVRAALAACVAAWNRRQPQAFADTCLTDDIWFSEADDSFYKRFRGRAAVLGLIDDGVRSTTLSWEVAWIRPQPDGTMAARLKQQVDTASGKRFSSDPSFARLRRQGNDWKVYFFTSHERWAMALITALDAPPPAASAPQTPRPAIAQAPAIPGTEPAAYAARFGSPPYSCAYCHGLPNQREDSKRGRIVAVAAAAADGAAVRRAMGDAHLGGILRPGTDEPTLTDAHLDAIRLWMRSLRDGRAELLQGVVKIHNPRSPRDEPVRIIALRAEGGWKLPRGTGCVVGKALAGGAHCEVRLPADARGALVFQLRRSNGLDPQPVRVEIGS
ncbi:MAG: hypothetical protein JNJ89_17220 [Rubrivivax sp.]|nr:hypothetical protein [Rubrivivax sp.]